MIPSTENGYSVRSRMAKTKCRQNWAAETLKQGFPLDPRR